MNRWRTLMKHIIDPLDLSVEELDSYLDLADRIFANPEKYAGRPVYTVR